MTYRVQNKQY